MWIGLQFAKVLEGKDHVVKSILPKYHVIKIQFQGLVRNKGHLHFLLKEQILQGVTLKNLLIHRIILEFEGKNIFKSRNSNNRCEENDVLNLYH
jgi:hypothetical protein